MSHETMWLKIIVPCLYVVLAGILYLWNFEIVLNLFAIPWSIPLMMFSGLIAHATVNGNTIISVGSMIGVILNICLYLFILKRMTAPRQKIESPERNAENNSPPMNGMERLD